MDDGESYQCLLRNGPFLDESLYSPESLFMANVCYQILMITVHLTGLRSRLL
jgi:hypothetical protein